MAVYKDVENFSKLFDEEFKKTKALIEQGETHLDNLAEGFLEADRVIRKMPTADVVPKSEVDRLETEIRLLTENSILAKYPCCVSCSKGLILTKSLEEYDKLLADIASEVAREIFEKLDSYLWWFPQKGEYVLQEDIYDKLKGEYTESEDTQ